MKIQKIFPLIILIFCTVFVFFPALNGDYLNWDDNQQITNNADVLNFSWQSVKNYFSSFYVNSYQPLASLSFGLEYSVFGHNSIVPHITNMMLHILNIIILFFLLSRLLPKQKIIRFFVLIVFAFHPLQAELIGWISTRSTLLYSFFFLLSCLSYLRYLSDYKKKKKYLWIAFLLFVFSILSKATGIVLPLVLLSFDYLYRRKISWTLLLEKTPFFIGSTSIGIVALISRRIGENQGDFVTYYSFYEKISISCHAFFLYFKKCFIPEDLIFFYGYPYKLGIEKSIEWSFLRAPLWVILIVLFCWAVYRGLSKEHKRLWVFGFLFFIINIFIVINFTPFSATFFAERYMYLAIIGVFIALVVIITNLIDKTPLLKNGFYILLGVYVLYFGIATHKRSSIWNTDMSLWTYVTKRKSQNSTPYRKLGQLYAKKENNKKAIEIYNNGISINPYSVDLYYWRGLSIMNSGDLEYAKKDFQRVITAKDELIGQAFYQKALIFKKQHLLDSVQVNMDSAKIYNVKEAFIDNTNVPLTINYLQKTQQKTLARIDSLIKSENFEEAITNYDNLSLIFPDNPRYFLEKGKLEFRLQNLDASIKSFTKAITLDPEHKSARLSRAFSYFYTKKYNKSIKDYSYVIENSEKENGEIYYFRALSYFNNKQSSLGCTDIKKASDLGYIVPPEVKENHCK